jgi:beta-lactamase regulating signal transducer with metallopeptidase domain
VSRVSETSTTPTSSDDDTVRRGEQQRATTRQAWTVVLVITLIAALAIAQFAFSTANDNQSVDGSTATSSQYVD